MIDTATDDIIAQLDTDIPEDAWPVVRKLISLRAAMEVELSYYPEQAGTDRSAYRYYKDLFDQGMTRAQQAVERETFEETTGQEYGELAMVYNFTVPPVNWDSVAM
jgi:hypothetical protein